jgi:MULE transposase domain
LYPSWLHRLWLVVNLTVSVHPWKCCLCSYNTTFKLWHKISHVPTLQNSSDLHLHYGFKNDEKILLIFFFVHDEEFRWFRMNPEVVACDTTFGVEKTKKGLFKISGVDGNNSLFNCGRAFIPSEQAWAFRVLFHDILSAVLGSELCSRVRRICTDGCVQQYTTLVQSFGSGMAFPNAVHTLCFYHVVVQKWGQTFRKDNDKWDQKVIDCSYKVLCDLDEGDKL